jgi:hypothetical protein
MNQYNVKLSAFAYNTLCERARDFGYVQAQTNKGVGQFIAACAQGTWRDIRSEQHREAAVQFPNATWAWSLEYPRLRYKIALPAEAFAYYQSLAKTFGIGLRFTGTASIVGAVLEAIGCDMLAPNNPPPKKPSLWRPQKEVVF